jgi:hypothetical protein
MVTPKINGDLVPVFPLLDQWENDLKISFQNRGVDEENVVPYYPYRDDGRLISESIKTFVSGFVDL